MLLARFDYLLYVTSGDEYFVRAITSIIGRGGNVQ
jgi:hypothetical protein